MSASSSSDSEDMSWGPHDPDPINEKYFALIKTSLKNTAFKWSEVGSCRFNGEQYHATISIYNIITGKEHNFRSKSTFSDGDDIAKETSYKAVYQILTNFLISGSS